jgi:predicted Zn-dependent protease with MMP-like domain
MERPDTAPTADDIEAIARVAYGSLPAAFRDHTGDVVIRVDEFPDEETLDEMGCETAFDLLGLYRGISLDRRSVLDTPVEPDMIFLYRRPLLDYWCESGDSLTAVVRHVLIHEIGHHFGLSDEDMAAIEAEAD